MRIGFILTGDFEEGNGANSRIKAYAKGLSAENEKVEILLLHASSFNHSNINTRKSGTWEGIRFQFLNGRCSRPEGLWGKLLDSLRSVVYSTLFLLRYGRAYDAFYLYGPKLQQAFHLYALLKLLGVPLVVEMTEQYSAQYQKWSLRRPQHLVGYYLNRFQERFLGRFSNHVVVISKKLYEAYRSYVPERKLSLIPIIVDFQRFQHLNGRPYKPFRVGYIGSFGQKDGVPGILQAYLEARKNLPELRLRLIGFGENEAFSTTQLASQGDPMIEFMGQVFYQNIPDYLHSCDLLIVNRPDTPYAHYGFPTKLAEYLATGRPTIVTNVGDVSHYFKSDRETLIVEPDDPQALQAAILARYQDYHFYNQVGLAGADRCKVLFDHHHHVDSLKNLLYQVTGGPRDLIQPDHQGKAKPEPVLPRKSAAHTLY